MPLTRDNRLFYNSADVSGSPPSSLTTGNVALTSGRLVVVLATVATQNNNRTLTVSSSPSMTWTQNVRSPTNVGQYHACVIATAIVPTTQDYTITVTCDQSTISNGHIAVIEYTGHDTTLGASHSGGVADSGSGSITGTLSASPASSSEVLAIAGSAAINNNAWAVASGWTKIDSFSSIAIGGVYSHRSIVSARSGSTSTSVGYGTYTEVSDDQMSYAALEIREAAAATGDAFQPGAFQTNAFQTSAGPVVNTITVTSGTLQLQGGTISLNAVRRLTVNAGTVQLQGASVGLNRTRRIAVTAGAVTLQGATVALNAVRRIAVTAGNLVLGGSANLNAVRRLTVTAGTVQLQGASTNLTAVRRIAVTPGTLTLQGASSLLAANRLLTVTAGGLVLQGATVDLTYVQNAVNAITVTGGTLALQGGTISLNAVRRIAVTSQTLQLQGASATLRAIRLVAVSPGTLQLQAGSNRLNAVRRLSVTGGTLQLQGGTVDLTPIAAGVNILSVTPGTLRLEGETVDLRYVVPRREPTGGAMLARGSGQIYKVEDDGEIKLFARNWRLPRLRVPKLPLTVAPYNARGWVADVALPQLMAPALKLTYDDTPDIVRILGAMGQESRQEESWTLVPGATRIVKNPLGSMVEQHLWRSSEGREEWWAFSTEWGINAEGQPDTMTFVWRSPSGKVVRRRSSLLVT